MKAASGPRNQSSNGTPNPIFGRFDFPREEIGERFQEKPFAVPAAELAGQRHTGRQLHHTVIQKGGRNFSPVRHGSDIDLRQEIAGEIGDQVGEADRGHRVAGGAQGGAGGKKIQGIGIGQAVEEGVQIQ